MSKSVYLMGFSKHFRQLRLRRYRKVYIFCAVLYLCCTLFCIDLMIMSYTFFWYTKAYKSSNWSSQITWNMKKKSLFWKCFFIIFHQQCQISFCSCLLFRLGWLSCCQQGHILSTKLWIVLFVVQAQLQPTTKLVWQHNWQPTPPGKLLKHFQAI